MSKLVEVELTGAMVLNDDKFWRGVYEEHGPSIMAFLKSRSGTTEDAEEMFQETFARAIQYGESLRDRSKVRSFLFTTAHNLLRNKWRRAAVSPIQAESAPDVAGPESADSRARFVELADRLEEILMRMTHHHRDAFKLGVLERRPYREIAERLGWSVSAVKINVFRARKQVIESLGGSLLNAGGGR